MTPSPWCFAFFRSRSYTESIVLLDGKMGYNDMQDCIDHHEILFDAMGRNNSKIPIYACSGSESVKRVFGKYGTSELINPMNNYGNWKGEQSAMQGLGQKVVGKLEGVRLEKACVYVVCDRWQRLCVSNQPILVFFFFGPWFGSARRTNHRILWHFCHHGPSVLLRLAYRPDRLFVLCASQCSSLHLL